MNWLPASFFSFFNNIHEEDKMGRKKSEAKVTCKNSECGKVIFLTDGKSLKKKRSILCPHCGVKNKVQVKKNGRIRIHFSPQLA